MRVASRFIPAMILVMFSFSAHGDGRSGQPSAGSCADTFWRDAKEAMGRRQVPIACVSGSAETFADLDTAARAALDAAVRLSREFEYGGLVIRCGDAYAFTAPVTNRSTVSVRYRYAYPSTCSIAAMYHAHPTDSRWASGESAADMDARKHLGVPSYILVIRSGIVKVFE